MRSVTIEIPVKAQPKQSVRFGRYGAYPDPKKVQYINLLKLYMVKHKQKPLMSKNITLTILLTFKGAPLGDLDNFCKSLMDSMKGIIIDDDRNVMMLSISKIYHAPEDKIAIMVEGE